MDTPFEPKIPGQDAPSGTVTFLFTDIEGSTKLLEQLREQYGTLLADHRLILRQVFARFNGHEVDTQGDAFFVAFPRATQAVAAAVEAQRALAEHAWPEAVCCRVRMGLHTGEPWSGEEGYVGMDVHRAARIAHVGHGGQVLLSETTTALVLDELPAGVSLLDLGRHLLKDIHRPERIHQLMIEGLSAEFPPLTSLEALPPESTRKPRKLGDCPYRGLSAFQEFDAPFYFGREDFIDALEHAIQTKKLVAVIVGSSGSGKSSAIFAGLLPRMRCSGIYQFANLRPGGQPFYSLAGALLPLLEPGMGEIDRLAETRKLAERLVGDEISLAQVAGRILEKSPGTRQVLVVVDQFEELYTLCPDAQLQKAFIDELLRTVEAASTAKGGLAIILLTLRADFMGQALAHRPFADALQEASLLMGPMTREELRVAIEKPAEMQGAAFEPGLVERILDDVGDKPGNLPLLEFTLTQLWEQQSDGWLTHSDYEAMGCVDGALAAYADKVYTDLSPDEQKLSRRALVQLVQPGEGTEDTRRIAFRVELGDKSWGLIQRLADRRLVVTGRDAQGRETAEVVHEALIQKWELFQEWMDSDRLFRLWQERLRSSLRQWQESGQDEGALLAGVPLAVAQSWLSERIGELSASEAEFVRASQAHQIRRQNELERRRNRTILALAAGLFLVAALGVVALLAGQQANRSAQTAQTEANYRATAEAVAVQERQNALQQAAVLLAGQAEAELADGYHDRAVLLALEALENYPYTPQAEHALGQAVSYSRALQQIAAHQSALTSLAWSPDGKRVASSGSSDNNVHIWDPATGKTILLIDMPNGITGNKLNMALNVQWTPDGKRLLTLTGDRYTLGSQDYDLLLWDAASGELISSLEIANQAEPESGDLSNTYINYPTGSAAEIAPSSGRLATLGGDNTALIWDAAWQKPMLVLSGHTKGVSSVDWSPDEANLTTASLDGTAMIWDAKTGQELFKLEGHEGRVNLALWSPDGSQIATGGGEGIVRIWDAATGELQSSIPTNAGEVFSLVWAPNGVRIFTGHGDGSLRIWETASGKLLETLRGHQGIVSDLKWSPVDDRLASGDGSGFARIWNAAPSTAWRLYPPQAASGADWTVQGASWSSDSRYLAMAGGDVIGSTEPPSFNIWDVQENKIIMEKLGDELNFMGLEAHFSPDDQAILYLGLKGFPDFSALVTAYVFDAQSGEIISTFTPGGDTLIRSAAWSPDGSQVATGLFSGEILIWNYKTGQQLGKLVHCNAGFMIGYVDWSPDGTKIATACDDSTARVWDAQTWEPLYTLQHEPPTYVNTANWSPDGKRLLTAAGNDEQGSKDNTARIWDGGTGNELLVYSGHTKATWPGDWSPNGERVATFGNDGTVRVWDSSNGGELLTLSVPVLYGGYAWWSPDGRHLAVVGSETLISIWRIWQSKEELIEYARQYYVIRELTPEERQQFGLQ